ncbi:hypothetical protein T439DRAFT_293826, partial [Meredithblackwellia eburnea MCA 4105]
GKTDAQRRFEEVQRKRLLEKAAKAATRTHKDRVAEFNEKLENLSEHYDIPKVRLLLRLRMARSCESSQHRCRRLDAGRTEV